MLINRFPLDLSKLSYVVKNDVVKKDAYDPKIKNTEDKIPYITKKKQKKYPFSKCAVCDSKKSKFIKEQEASGLLSSLGIKLPLRKLYLVGPPLF